MGRLFEDAEIIAHRGFSAIAPENTLAAFIAAIEHQADSIEFDVQISRDGVPVIIHDVSVDRTSNGIGLVREKTVKELQALDAGSWFNSQFAGEKIPTLESALEAVAPIHTYIYAEVKNAEYWTDNDVDIFLEIIINNSWQEKCIVACFNHSFLDRIRHRDRQIQVGYLVANLNNYTEVLPSAIADGNAIMMSKYQVLLDNPALIETTKNQGIDIVTWTVDSQDDLQKLTQIGVSRIATNCLI